MRLYPHEIAVVVKGLNTTAMVLGGGASASSSTRKSGTAVGTLRTVGHLMTNGDDFVVQAKFIFQ